ncbi:MAG: ABC transporter ATP-binding protein [Spirochaetes bacterium]|nr:ABC transporter ATP-binding protein [Spirochaetota bacterium]
MLSIRNLGIRYGQIDAVRNINFDVNDGEIVCLIGANGAGKTSTLCAIMGLVPIANGSIEFSGTDLGGMPTEKIVRMGISLIPEGRRIFSRLSVEKNLLLGGITIQDDDVQSMIGEMYSRFPILKERCNQLAGTLSGGEQQMLAVARSLMSKPKMLLMDEPSLGLAPMLVKSNFDLICRLRDEGNTILLVEQNVNQSLRITDRAYIIENGELVASGSGSELMESDFVRNSYLGITDSK